MLVPGREILLKFIYLDFFGLFKKKMLSDHEWCLMTMWVRFFQPHLATYRQFFSLMKVFQIYPPRNLNLTWHLKMDGWKTIVSIWDGFLAGAFREGNRISLLSKWLVDWFILKRPSPLPDFLPGSDNKQPGFFFFLLLLLFQVDDEPNRYTH